MALSRPRFRELLDEFENVTTHGSKDPLTFTFVAHADKIHNYVAIKNLRVVAEAGPNASLSPMVHVAWIGNNATDPADVDALLVLPTVETVMPGYLQNSLQMVCPAPDPHKFPEMGSSLKPLVPWSAAPKIVWWFEPRIIPTVTAIAAVSARLFVEYDLEFSPPVIAPTAVAT
jgi:hypothetical protein